MISRMRTTLILDDGLLRQAKRRAVERNLTVSAVVNEALRESLSRTVPEAPPFKMITYGDPSRKARHEPADFSAILEEQDLESLR